MRLVFFDLETGGLDPERHPIIQIAAVAVDERFRVLEEFQRKLIVDVRQCDPDALAHNHFDPEVWAQEGCDPGAALADFTDFLCGYRDVSMVSKRTGKPYSVAQLAGHNAAEFDMRFLKAWFTRENTFLPAHPRALDTVQMALAWSIKHCLVLDDLKLTTLCRYLAIPLGDAARDALADCRATVMLARTLFVIPADGDLFPNEPEPSAVRAGL